MKKIILFSLIIIQSNFGYGGIYNRYVYILNNDTHVYCIAKDSEDAFIGLIIDEEGNPVSFASISLLSKINSSLITGGVSDENGRFSISCPDVPMVAKISCIGYKTIELPITTKDIGNIRMSADTNLLNDVIIVGHRKYISRENGRLTLNVQNSNLQNIGKATDVIKYVPGMLYTNGKYEVFGKGACFLHRWQKGSKRFRTLLAFLFQCKVCSTYH